MFHPIPIPDPVVVVVVRPRRPIVGWNRWHRWHRWHRRTRASRFWPASACNRAARFRRCPKSTMRPLLIHDRRPPNRVVAVVVVVVQ